MKKLSPWREKLYDVIFNADTYWGKTFDVVLLIFIFASVLTICLESVESIYSEHQSFLYGLEWFFTIAFTLEYIARLISVRKPIKYIFSFFGIIDLISILPTYASLFIPGAQTFLIIRIFRLLRIFRVFKLARFMGEASLLKDALIASKPKIIIFLGTVISIIVVAGAMMFIIEGPENGFTSIPLSIYWAIVTLTTVGYGDIVPVTALGRFVASLIVIMGYGVIAVPTGIVSSELTAQKNKDPLRACTNCNALGHELIAKFCNKCGAAL